MKLTIEVDFEGIDSCTKDQVQDLVAETLGFQNMNCKVLNENLNEGNKCAQLWEGADEYLDSMEPTEDWLGAIFDMQSSLQERLGRNVGQMPFEDRIQFIKDNWTYLTTEYTELIERLPFKPWKKYTEEQKAGFLNEEHKLEVWYEWCDMLHFFVNMGLALGITGEDAFKLYYTKNKENFARQDRGY